jgi:hypothetical protein
VRDISVQTAVQARALARPIMQHMQNMSVVVSLTSQHIGGMYRGQGCGRDRFYSGDRNGRTNRKGPVWPGQNRMPVRGQYSGLGVTRPAHNGGVEKRSAAQLSHSRGARGSNPREPGRHEEYLYSALASFHK